MRVLTNAVGTVLVTLFISCSSGGNETKSPVPPVISTQPKDVAVLPGQPATFSVVAAGTPPLSYRWLWNGLEVPDGGSSFTAITQPSDNQSSLAVEVSNASGTVTSATATLKVLGAPRPPKPGDLRFKEVDSFPVALLPGQDTNIIGLQTTRYTHAVGGPLLLTYSGGGNPGGLIGNMTWFYRVLSLPAGTQDRSVTYKGGLLAEVQTDLASLPGNAVVSSLDLNPYPQTYGCQIVYGQSPAAFTQEVATVLPDGLQATASREGAAGRVITALGMNQGSVTYVTYGWQGDLTTTYEAKVTLAGANELAQAFTDLSQAGYILTAFGGNTLTGFAMIGTRVTGDATPRPFLIWKPGDTPTIGRGLTCVASVGFPAATNGGAYTYLWMYQQ